MTEKKRKISRFDSLSLHMRQGLFLSAFYLIVLIICLIVIAPVRYDVNVGDVSTQTIIASKDVVDEITTERRRKAAADAVLPVYYKDDSVSDVVLANMETTLSELRAVRELGDQIEEGWSDETTSTFTQSDFQQAESMLTTITLSNYQLRTLMNTSEADFESLSRSLTSATRTALISTITEGQINDAISNIQQIVAYNTRTDLWYNIAIPTLRTCLRANMLIDQEATEENRQKARDAVEPTVYKQNQNIVVKGDQITEEQYAVIASLGLLTSDSADYSLYISSAVLLALIFGIVIMLVYLFDIRLFSDRTSVLVMMLAFILTLLLSITSGTLISIHIMPLALAAMIVVNLLGSREAFIVNLMLTVVMTFLIVAGQTFQTSQMLIVLFEGFIGGNLTIFLMRKQTNRIYILLMSLVIGIVDIAIILGVLFLSSSDMSGFSIVIIDSMLSVLVSAILCIGIQPIFESVLNLVTPLKLIELSSPSQPLLKRLMVETPGTYHHSMLVANLGEAAAEAVGANALLVRVGAYYHDIGKLVRPLYFVENQHGENPHDKTDPRISTEILTEHVRDGVDLARKHHLPDAIIDMIQQHHGDTAAYFFYAKAVKLYGEENVDINDFRYDGPKPRSAEAAILMLADTVEAAVRSIQDPTKEKISDMIRKLVRRKMEDGQLDECTLTFRDIGKICSAFETALSGVYHQRIAYPEVRGHKNKKEQPKDKT